MFGKHEKFFFEPGQKDENDTLFLGSFMRYMGAIAKNMVQPVIESIRWGERYATRKIIGVLTIAIGELFLLNGLSILISDLVGAGRWAGYVIIGGIMLAIGLIINNR